MIYKCIGHFFTTPNLFYFTDVPPLTYKLSPGAQIIARKIKSTFVAQVLFRQVYHQKLPIYTI